MNKSLNKKLILSFTVFLIIVNIFLSVKLFVDNNNKISFQEEIDLKSRELFSLYIDDINKGLEDLKNVPMSNDMSKSFTINRNPNFDFITSYEFEKRYKDYIEKKYNSLYSTKYKFFIIHRSIHGEHYRIIFYYK